MAEKFNLRDPDYLDLSSDTWKLQPRDSHGRWSKSPGGSIAFEQPQPLKEPVKVGLPLRDSLLPGEPVPRKHFGHQFKKVERLRKKPLPQADESGSILFKSSHTHVEARTLDRGEIRQTLSLDHKQRDMLFESAGLKSEYHESETELIHKWHETSDSKERARLEHEMLVRQKALTVALSTVREASTLAEREDKRSRLQKFDDHLKGSKVGQALLKIRDKMVSDKAFDRAEKVRDAVKEYGEDWAKHLANSALVKGLVGSAVALAANYLGGDQLPEAIRAFTENPVAEAGIAAACGIALGLGLKMLHRGVKAAPKVKQKVKVKVSNAADPAVKGLG